MKNSLVHPASRTMMDVLTVLEKWTRPIFVGILYLQYIYAHHLLIPSLFSSLSPAWTLFHDFIAPFMLWCYALLHTETSVWALAWHKAKWGIMEEWKREGWTPVVLEHGITLWAVSCWPFCCLFCLTVKCSN